MNETDAKSRILAVATRLFGEKGFDATSVREVVDAAGVTKPTLYYWFENKEALFLEAVGVQIEKGAEITRQTLETGGAFVERVQNFVSAYIDSALTDEDGVRLMISAHHPSGDGQPMVDAMALMRPTIDSLIHVLEEAKGEGLVKPPVDCCVAALSLLGAAHLHIGGALNGMPVPEDLAERLVRNFLYGVSS